MIKKITVNAKNILRKIDLLENIVNRKFLESFGNKRITEMMHRLLTSKKDVNKKKFKSLSESYKMWKQNITGRPEPDIGVLYGEMVNSFEYKAEDKSIMIANRTDYSESFNIRRQFFESGEQMGNILINDIILKINQIKNKRYK